MNERDMLHPALPWWRVPMVWLVIAGPATVVVASVLTFGTALSGADTDVRDVQAARQAAPHTGPLAPAAQARNHAATPVRP
jgi:hypothetical protein